MSEDEWRWNYEGAMSDLDSVLDVLIRRINGDADLSSAAEWVRLNYPEKAKLIRYKARRPRQRTYWQRFSLDVYARPGDTPALKPDYMGNSEYEWGTFPKALAAIQAPKEIIRIPVKPSASFPYYPSARDGKEPLKKPTQQSFIGDPAAIKIAIDELTGKEQDNKAGLLGEGVLLWMPVDPRAHVGPGFIVLNDSWIDQTYSRDLVEAFIRDYFKLKV